MGLVSPIRCRAAMKACSSSAGSAEHRDGARVADTSSTLASDQQPDETVVREVLNYFLRNPQAVDSLEGIALWRLLDEGVGRKVEETRKALEWLVRQKYLSKTMVAGGDPVFSLNPDNIAKAKAFLSAPDLRARKKKS